MLAPVAIVIVVGAAWISSRSSPSCVVRRAFTVPGAPASAFVLMVSLKIAGLAARH